jgi:AraC-like DNA-binding protein
VTSGRGELRLADGDCARLDEGDLLLVPPGATCSLGGPRSRAEVIIVRVSDWWVEAACRLAAGSAVDTTLREVSLERSGTDLARRGDRLLRRLCITAGQTGFTATLRDSAMLLELVALAFECRAGVHKPISGRRGSRHRIVLESALAALAEEPLEGLSLGRLASRLALSERQVSRLIQEELGCSFREWATGVRLARARQLLAESELPIIEIAAETGWSSLAHFNALFRRRTGRTPGAFRSLQRSMARDPAG